MAWGDPDRIPLTVYDWMLPRGMAERHLREADVGLIVRLPGHRVQHREVEIVSQEYHESGADSFGGRSRRRWARSGSSWSPTPPTKPPTGSTSTSSKARRLSRPGILLPRHDIPRQFPGHPGSQRRVGTDGIVLLRIAKSPVQEMLYQMMGLEQFAFDYQERRDPFDSLHATMSSATRSYTSLRQSRPRRSSSSATTFYSDVVGRERFQRYLMPEYARSWRGSRGPGSSSRSTWTAT